ncbi:putative ferric-chelate reductase 1 homolog isoform X3 [Sitodiplosis mosellana]|nr:putative ferric-chelate reductase 1 homolog isoform X3 [Sitodiplosis mosellana]XP_055318322.1 putative ferric-chelate reductase 1 homolog isoform X3 [Sitodiplosis mosellana]XP_055318323.1 putative ferric-chelate reductase 1 homolog isoform X3 [Sitodiplosis mosellana]
MYRTQIVVILLVAYSFQPIITLPQGAPDSVCHSLLPFHGGGILPSSSRPPYRIVPHNVAVNQGQILRVEIEPQIPELTFGGFMIHARNINPPYQVVGRFAPPADNQAKLINCGGFDNTATHTSPSPKSGISLQWQAPSDFLGDIVFNATVAQEYAKFWVGIESPVINVISRNVPVPAYGRPVSPSTRRPPYKEAIPNYVPISNDQYERQFDPIYEGCGETKSCFGFPDGCVDSKSCQTVATSIVRGERYEFEIKSSPRDNPAYVAVALSNDDKMGDDSVMECVPEAGQIRAYTSWTMPRPNLGVTRQGVPQNMIRLLDASYVDGVIYCRILREPRTNILGNNFDLINNKYHLLVASGSSLKPNSVGYHDIGRIASGSPSYLADVGVFGGASKLFLRLHAAFMITAWIGTASIGILLARYFKQTWVGSQLCGKDQWFAWHRMFMILTWALTIAAFVLIFVELGAWSAEDNPHAILGTITTIVCFLQPFGALFRPAPTSSKRPIFNWLHWLGGNVAHILAIVTIFFAVKLTKAELPSWFDWILVAFVAFHVIVHLVLSIFSWIQICGCVSERSAQRVNNFPMADMSPSRSSMKERKLDAPFSGLRKIILTIYLVIVIMFVVVLVLIAVFAPIQDAIKSLQNMSEN